jgi:predicted solute-binding protein
VNEYSFTLGDEGRRAVNELFARAAAAGVAPAPSVTLWVT